jgi:putative membrane protein
MSNPALTRLRSATARLRFDFELSCTADFYFDKILRLEAGAGKFFSVSRQNKLVTGLAGFCAVIWSLAAIHPVDRQAWVLENLLLVLFVVALALMRRYLHFSNASYIFIALFIILHIIGAHYTYAKMPLGLWARDFFGFSRNHFDRVAHFGFGFFLAFPIRELLLRFSGIRRPWSFWLPPAIILAIGGFFEILEGIVAEIIAPGKGVEWLGGQGDEWDAQNDMLSAFLGSLTMMAVVLFTNRKRKSR